MAAIISAILVSRGPFEVVRNIVRSLAAQKGADEIELVLVGTLGPVVHAPADCNSFASVQTVQCADGASIASGNAAGVRAATAPIVVLCEDHCFPQPGWLEALLEAHRKGMDVVGPAFENANPGNTISWCDFVIGYGPFMHPGRGGLRDFLPGHNSSYRRADLIALGEKLEQWLEAETVLHYEFSRQGKALWFEPKARVAHLNFALFPAWMEVQFHGGRVFGASRVLNSTLVQRWIWILGSPLIAPLRFSRIAVLLSRLPGGKIRLLRIAPMLAIGLAADAAGQFMGYAFGFANSLLRVAELEANRVDYILPQDRMSINGSIVR